MPQPLVDVIYLEGSDINDDGSLKSSVHNNKPVIVMVQGNFCHFCTDAKPDFQRLAQTNSNVRCCTVQIDGEENDKQAASKFQKYGGRGVPSYFVFDKNGKFVQQYNQGRDFESLNSFCNAL
jgi:thiol-disulfide isomerase/thioredoxin